MLKRSNLVRSALCLAIIGAAFLLIPPYKQYCETGYPNQYNCAAYEMTASFVTFLDSHGVAVTALATIAIAWFTFTLWRSNDIAAEHTRVVERAFVKMSHDRPGVIFAESDDCCFDVPIMATNYGHTPAEITDTHVTQIVAAKDSDLPTKPPYKRETGLKTATKAFLVANGDQICYTHSGSIKSEREHIRRGKQRLYIFGYVDYKDVFGVRHRGGYARRYEPIIDALQGDNAQRTNLVFVDIPGYNYDHPRVPGEGNDWNE